MKPLILLLLSRCLFWAAAETEFEYEVQEEPLKDVDQDQRLPEHPTGEYSFLDVHRKKASSAPLVTKETPETNIVLSTEPESHTGVRYILDLALVLDSSYTITLVGWINVKEAAKKLIDGLDISPEGTHVAIMKFSTDVEKYYMFRPDVGKDTLKTQIDGLTYDGQWSRLDTALKAVDHHVFVPVGGARLGNVPKAVVIFSDGKADGPSGPDEDINWQQKTAEPIHSLKQKNVEIFAVAAGETDEVTLHSITSNPTRIFDMENIDQLVEALKGVSQRFQFPLEPPVIPSLQRCEKATITVTVTETPSSKILSTMPSVEIRGTHTVTRTVTATKSITSTPVTTLIETETTTALLTATETASPLKIRATKTNTFTEIVTATATESLTSTAMNTATVTLETNVTATEVVTLTTTLGVTSTTYAHANQTPIAVTIMAAVSGKKRRNAPNDRAKRWYKNYIPEFIKTWMAIEE